MNKSFRNILVTTCKITLCLLMAGCHSRGINFADLEHSDQQKRFEKKLRAQQNVIDSLAKMYDGKPMIVNTFNDFNGDPKKIILYHPSGYKILDTLKPGDTVQLIKVLPKYKFRTDTVVQILVNANTMVKTKKGVTGMISYYYIEEFKDVLKEKGLETDTL